MSTTSASSMQQNASHIGVGATKDLEKTDTTNETAKVSQNMSDETNTYTLDIPFLSNHNIPKSLYGHCH